MCEKCSSDVCSSYAQAFTNNMQQYNTAKTLTFKYSKMLFLLLIIQYPIHIVSYSHSLLFVLL